MIDPNPEGTSAPRLTKPGWDTGQAVAVPKESEGLEHQIPGKWGAFLEK